MELSHWECFPGGVAAGDAGSPPRPPEVGLQRPPVADTGLHFSVIVL